MKVRIVRKNIIELSADSVAEEILLDDWKNCSVRVAGSGYNLDTHVATEHLTIEFFPFPKTHSRKRHAK